MSTEKNLNNLVINKVESQSVYDYMKANSLINADELYFIEGDTDIADATESASGLMSASDKIKLDNIADGATNVTVDSALSDTSTNPVQNKIISLALNDKSPVGHTHSSEDVILTDTVTGTQYQLFMTNGKLTAVVVGEGTISNYDNGDEVMY